MDNSVSITYDELNLIEYPLMLFGENEIEEAKQTRVREYTITAWDKGKSKHLLQGYVKIYGISDNLRNFLYPYEEEVLLELIKISSETYFKSKVIELENINLLLERMSWKRCGKNYYKLKEAFLHLTGITIDTNLFWNRKVEAYERRIFHIIDRISSDRFGHKNPNKRNAGKRIVEIEWSETIYNSFIAGNIKPLNLTFYKSLESPVAKRLYRVIDRRFYKKATVKIPVAHLGINILGIGPKVLLQQMEEVISKHCEELVAKNYLRSFNFETDDRGRRIFVAHKMPEIDKLLSELTEQLKFK